MSEKISLDSSEKCYITIFRKYNKDSHSNEIISTNKYVNTSKKERFGIISYSNHMLYPNSISLILQNRRNELSLLSVFSMSKLPQKHVAN